MSFNILALRTSDDTDSTIWPVPARAPGGLITEAEPGDGQRVVCIPVAAVSIGKVTDSGIRQVMSLGDLTAWACITDSRVIFAASKFEKGSSWVGWGPLGVTVAVAATGISKARAASRSRGKILAGQIRYPWLRQAGASLRDGRKGANRIRLGYATHEQGMRALFVLDMRLPWGTVSPLQAAQDIARRCAAYRLKNYRQLDDNKRARLTELASTALAPPSSPDRYAIAAMPDFYYVAAATAFPADVQAEAHEAPAHDKTSGRCGPVVVRQSAVTGLAPQGRRMIRNDEKQ